MDPPDVGGVVDDPATQQLLSRLSGPDGEPAWNEWLALYSPVLRQVAGLLTRDEDAASDAFVAVCDGLRANRFERLRQFRPDGRACFTTWLRAVARNLCIDRHRQLHGRRRDFEAIAHMPPVERAVFRLVLLEGRPCDEVALTLVHEHPDIDASRVASIAEALRAGLGARQLRSIAAHRITVEALADDTDVPSEAPDPEQIAINADLARRLDDALTGLEPEAVLLVRLRYEQGLTLQRIAALTGLRDAQTADRRIRAALAQICDRMLNPERKSTAHVRGRG